MGRRPAYDLDKGRLWVVCRSCERWNLSPLAERWEALEALERAYRDTKTRASTENIGLARALSLILPKVNATGAGRSEVRDAVRLIEAEGIEATVPADDGRLPGDLTIESTRHGCQRRPTS